MLLGVSLMGVIGTASSSGSENASGEISDSIMNLNLDFSNVQEGAMKVATVSPMIQAIEAADVQKVKRLLMNDEKQGKQWAYEGELQRVNDLWVSELMQSYSPGQRMDAWSKIADMLAQAKPNE